MKNNLNFKDQYKKYSLITIILILGVVTFCKMTPFMGGVLGGITIYILVRRQMKFLEEEKKLKKGFAATLLVIETIMFFLIPLSFVVIILIEKFSTMNLNPQEWIKPIEDVSHFIQQKTGYYPLKPENLNYLIELVPRIGQFLMNGISSFLINVFVLIFVLYFMLIGRVQIENYLYDMLPFSSNTKKEVLHEINLIVTSNAIGIPLLAIFQGGVAMIGYFIFNVPNALIFGFLTGITTVIPVIGTGLVWVPLSIYLAIIGDWTNAIGILSYGLLIVSQVDNLIRFILQKKMADIHPLITIFGVVIGLSLFGFMGVIFGPLLLSMLMLCIDILKKEYLC